MFSTTEWLNTFPLDDLLGLKPRCALVLGHGYGREEIKACLLARVEGAERALTASAVTTLEGLALQILGWTKLQVLGPLARQEALRWWMGQSAVAKHLPELKELRRERTFYSKLDHAFQAGRMSYATEDERSVYEARVGDPGETTRQGRLRKELQVLQTAFESWMDSEAIADSPELLAKATERLRTLQGEERERVLARIPERLIWLSTRARESRESHFWAALQDWRSCESAPEALTLLPPPVSTPLTLERWHSIDDVAERLADRLVNDVQEGVDDQVAIVISDRPEVRRSIARVFGERGLPIADPRDPDELKRSERIKWALLPLACVSSRYAREEVFAYIKFYEKAAQKSALSEKAQRQILEDAVVRGIEGYRRAAPEVGDLLLELEASFGGRRTVAELASAHLAWIDRHSAEVFLAQDRAFWSRFWLDFEADLSRLPSAPKASSMIFWFERIQMRLAATPAPISRAKPERGIALYRPGQAPLRAWKRVYFLSMEAEWLDTGRAGDFYWSERDRDVLASEFDVRSAAKIRQERTADLRRWIGHAGEVVILEEEFGCAGEERTASVILWSEVTGQPAQIVAAARSDAATQGAHPRWSVSYGALRAVQPQEVRLGAPRAPDWSASALDAYTKCGFLGLVQGRWRLEDLKDPESDLWPEVRGVLLHEAAALLLRSRTPDGDFSQSPEACLDAVWDKRPPRGLIRGSRIAQAVRFRLLAILQAFSESEKASYRRMPSELVISDDRTLTYELPTGLKIIGRPDRIDRYQTPEGPGLLVIDYKTSSDIPTGRDLDEAGYRLQLPLYALAAERKFSEPVLGVQFISLVRKGTRSSGVMFKATNGKVAAPITQLRADSRSLFDEEPAVVWRRFEEKILQSAASWSQGVFDPVPKFVEDCRGCQARDLCGVTRKSELDE